MGLDEDVAVAFVPAGDPGHIVDYELLGLLVKGDASLDVLLGAGLFQQPIDLRVCEAGVIVGAFGVEQDVQEVLGVRVVGHPA